MDTTSHLIRGTILLAVFILGTGWWMLRQLKNSEEPVKLIIRWVASVPLVAGILFMSTAGLFGVIANASMGLCLGIIWAPEVGRWVARPLAGIFDGGSQQIEARPFYSIARAKMKRSLYPEAIAAAREQLEKFPKDHEGQLLIAEIQAEHLQDLQAAAATVERLISQPGHAPRNIVFALNSLADWHVKVGQDPDSARIALERITQLYPDTELAQVARERIAHLTTREMLAAKRERAPIALKHAERDVGLRPGVAWEPPVENPEMTAEKLVKHLEEHPHDTEAREQVAMLYAEHYGRLDMAVDQLEQLVKAPNMPMKDVVRWLNLMAQLQLRIANDVPTARLTYQRIVDLFPGTVEASQAERAKALAGAGRREKSQGVSLGSYEKDLGLRKGLPKA